ncbi:MAG TPA: hypothetical protein ENO27_04345, partial [Caldithrix sp.]|nr:hypothetical protein [Caldithrix sp.]
TAHCLCHPLLLTLFLFQFIFLFFQFFQFFLFFNHLFLFFFITGFPRLFNSIFNIAGMSHHPKYSGAGNPKSCHYQISGGNLI